MKKRKILITAVLITAAVIYMFISSRRQNIVNVDQVVGEAHLDAATEGKRYSDEKQSKARAANKKIDSDLLWRPTDEEIKVIKESRVVIYGKVVDMLGNPIPKADIYCMITTGSESHEARSIQMKTDDKGDFVIDEINAPIVLVAASAEGYYSLEESGNTFYQMVYPQSMPESIKKMQPPRIKTTKEAPYLFKLRPMGPREALVHRYEIHRIGKHRGPIVDVDKTVVFPIDVEEKHSVQIRFVFDKDKKRVGAHPLNIHYDWSYEITVPSGEILKIAKTPHIRNPETFIAPESGYEMSIKGGYDITMDDNTYKDGLHNMEAFVKYTDDTYGRVIINVDARQSQPSIRIESWYNPSGSRGTEPTPKLYIKTKLGL